MPEVQPDGHASQPCPLTQAQLDVLRAVVKRGCRKAAAKALGCSPNTVHRHLTDIHARLGVESTTQAVALCLRNGWL